MVSVFSFKPCHSCHCIQKTVLIFFGSLISETALVSFCETSWHLMTVDCSHSTLSDHTPSVIMNSKLMYINLKIQFGSSGVGTSSHGFKCGILQCQSTSGRRLSFSYCHSYMCTVPSLHVPVLCWGSLPMHWPAWIQFTSWPLDQSSCQSSEAWLTEVCPQNWSCHSTGLWIL